MTGKRVVPRQTAPGDFRLGCGFVATVTEDKGVVEQTVRCEVQGRTMGVADLQPKSISLFILHRRTYSTTELVVLQRFTHVYGSYRSHFRN